MLFGAGNYQASVKSLDTNNNLYTAASYITTKFRQHDIPGMTSLTELQGTQVLCFQEAIEGKDYCTYISFDGSHLKDRIPRPIFPWEPTLHSFRISKLTLWKTLFTESH